MIRFLRLFEAYRLLEQALTKSQLVQALEEARHRSEMQERKTLFDEILASQKSEHKEEKDRLLSQISTYEAERRRRDDSFLIMCGARPIYEEVPETKPEPVSSLSNEGRIIEEHQAAEREWYEQQEDAMRVAAARARQVITAENEENRIGE